MAEAVAAFQGGRLDEAAGRLQRILGGQPGMPDALHLLGLVVHLQGDNAAAADLIARAIAAAGDKPRFHHNHGIVLRALGRLDEAEAAQRRAVALKPDYVEAHNHLGDLLQNLGRGDDAETAYRRAIACSPGDPRLHNNLGALLSEMRRFEDAAEALRRALTVRPDYAAAHANLGAALLELGDEEKAETHCRRAIELDPNNVDARNNLAMVLRERRDLKAADEALRAAIALAPDRADLHSALGKVLKDDGQPAAAEAACRRALDIVPDYADAHTGLGIALVDRGRIEEAVVCFRKALEIDPDNAGALYQLSVSQMQEMDDDDIGRMTGLLGDDRLTPRLRTTLCFALAKAHEKRGETERAFTHYRDGNARRRAAAAEAGERFDADEDSRQAARIMATFDGPFLAERAAFGDPSTLPAFVVGMPRSGTTLVEQIVASHPRTFGAEELGDVPELTKVLPAILGTERAYPECVDRLDALTAARLAGDYLDHLRALAPEAERVTDKNPFNFRHLGLIALLFPKARVVHCRRDPRDTALSCYINNLDVPTWSTDLADIGRYMRSYEALMEHWRAVLPLPVLDVVYEDMIADQEGQSRRLIDFLGLPWDPACLAFHETERVVLTASSWQVRRPLYAASVGRWRAFKDFLGPLQMALD